MSSFSTREAAQKLGLSLISLKRYIAARKIPMPPVTKVGGVRVRLEMSHYGPSDRVIIGSA